jgi:hypothetical protein
VPAFYVVLQRFAERNQADSPAATTSSAPKAE